MSSESGEVEVGGGASAEVLIEISAAGGAEAEVQSISTDGAAIAAPAEVRIDISADGSDVAAETTEGGGTEADDSIHSRRGRRGRSRSNRRASAIVETTLALGGQAIGAVVGAALTGRSSWFPVYAVELCIVLGLSFIFAALSLRRHRPGLSALAAKIGAVATTAAVVVAVASRLPVALASVVGPLTFVVVCVTVAYM